MSGSTQKPLFTADRLALEWRELEADRVKLWKEIAKYVREHGSRPHKTPGKLVAAGAENELAMIDAVLRTIRDANSLRRFLRACPKRLAARVMRRRVVWSPAAGAEKILLQHASAKVLRLYQAAVRVKKSKPRLVVRDLKPRRAHRKAAA
jgi:hypothetical protein